MKLYAIENASLKIDVTSVRHEAQEVIDLIEHRFGNGGGKHLSVIELDDGDTPLEDMIDSVIGNESVSLKIADSVVKSVVWPENSNGKEAL